MNIDNLKFTADITQVISHLTGNKGTSIQIIEQDATIAHHLKKLLKSTEVNHVNKN